MTGRPVPLAAAAALTVGGVGAAVVTCAGGVLAATGHGSALGPVLAATGAMTAVGAGLAAVLADRLATQLRALRTAATRRLHEPTDRQLDRWLAGNGIAELADLARTLDALTLRTKVADDVAEQHRRTAENASAGMFELLSGLVAAEEGARGQLAAELHDTVAQSLGMARMHLTVGDGDSLRSAQEFLEDAEEQVRAVMARTRPPALRDGDLASAIGHLRADLEQRYGMSVEVTWPTTAHPLPLVSAITVYRFFQEALLNVVKHADVDWAQAALVVDEDEIVATVSDAGPGFDPDQVKPEKGRHVGLGLLRERARLAGGSLEISSMPAAGTVLQLRLPRTASSGARADRALPLARSAS
ncbi:MAG TPA: sensor histidine kinase [Frankiaceae bacterium]|nr:sensor histidine kinase [Frankiaceae bacterium]